MHYKIKPGTVKPVQHPRVDMFRDKKVVVQCEVIPDDEKNEVKDLLGVSTKLVFEMSVEGTDTFDSIQTKAEQQAEISLNNVLVEKKKLKEEKEKKENKNDSDKHGNN